MKNFSIKTYFCITLIALMLFVYLSLNDLIHSKKTLVNYKLEDIEADIDKVVDRLNEMQNISKMNLKYILQWTFPDTIPFIYMDEGRNVFIKRNCTFTNCYVTADKNYFTNIRQFDVILFHGPEITTKRVTVMPERRSPHQKFTFVSIESSDYYPICSSKFDSFFNWTWTYKLNSNAKWSYLAIRDSENKVIGPSENMHWMKLNEMEPVSKELKKSLKTKKKTAAWFVSNCNSKSHREVFVDKLQKELQKYKLSVDIYGACGSLTCSSEKQDKCSKMIERDYYFYLSFENSFAEDYVTEKLLYPLQNNAIPIVFGAANYTRFMPDGIYLNAKRLGAEKLAYKMNELISNPDMYVEYFRWKNHYSYHSLEETEETDTFCGFCAMLNKQDLVKKISTYSTFREWWNPSRHRCY